MEHDPIIEAAENDLADVEARRHEIMAFLARYRRYREPTSSALVPTHPDTPVDLIRRSAPADKVMSAVHDILGERGDALTLSALFDALLDRGVMIGGRNPKQNLSQKLSAHEGLKSYGKRGWYFADTIPPCLLPSARLSANDHSHEEGPATEMTGPLQSNGATDWHSEASREDQAPV